MAKALYKPLGILFGVLGGVVASSVFQRVWSLVSDADDAPQATDEHRSWAEVLRPGFRERSTRSSRRPSTVVGPRASSS